MFDSLKQYERTVAVGLLARAALSLNFDENPAALPAIDGEQQLRSMLIYEARRKINVTDTDSSPQTIMRLCDYLDMAAEEYLPPVDTNAVLLRLSERGDLPSDIYEISILKSVCDVLEEYGRIEQDLIAATIRLPDKEQHYGRDGTIKDRPFVSLFFKMFTTSHPYKDFGLLVAASRDGMILHVGQAWRIYKSDIMTRESKSLVDILKMFAEMYGYEIEMDGRRGKFFEFAESSDIKSHTFVPKGLSGSVQVISFYKQNEDFGGLISSMVVAIDFKKYKKLIKKMWVNREEIRELRHQRDAKVSFM